MVIRQALIAKFLTKDIENYGLLKLTAKGYGVPGKANLISC